jgi:CRISPR/Cas system-associated endonuclease/helicase Cas3
MVEAVDEDILLNSSIDQMAKGAPKAASTPVVCNYVLTAQNVYRALKDKVKGSLQEEAETI